MVAVASRLTYITLTDISAVLPAVANNLTVIRMFAFTVVEGYNLQERPGVYNETLLVAMDYAIAKASSLGLKLIPVLANNWEYNTNMTDTKYALLKDLTGRQLPSSMHGPQQCQCRPAGNSHGSYFGYVDKPESSATQVCDPDSSASQYRAGFLSWYF